MVSQQRCDFILYYFVAWRCPRSYFMSFHLLAQMVAHWPLVSDGDVLFPPAPVWILITYRPDSHFWNVRSFVSLLTLNCFLLAPTLGSKTRAAPAIFLAHLSLLLEALGAFLVLCACCVSFGSALLSHANVVIKIFMCQALNVFNGSRCCHARAPGYLFDKLNVNFYWLSQFRYTDCP